MARVGGVSVRKNRSVAVEDARSSGGVVRSSDRLGDEGGSARVVRRASRQAKRDTASQGPARAPSSAVAEEHTEPRSRMFSVGDRSGCSAIQRIRRSAGAADAKRAKLGGVDRSHAAGARVASLRRSAAGSLARGGGAGQRLATRGIVGAPTFRRVSWMHGAAFNREVRWSEFTDQEWKTATRANIRARFAGDHRGVSEIACGEILVTFPNFSREPSGEEAAESLESVAWRGGHHQARALARFAAFLREQPSSWMVGARVDSA